MARARIIAGPALKKKRSKSDNKVRILLLINLGVNILIALKLFGVI